MYGTASTQAASPGRNVPTPSFEGTVAPEPPITTEIHRLQGDCADMVVAAISRVAKLRERLIGNVVAPDGGQLQEGLRWPPEGDLGRAYHQAYQLREALSRLQHELAQLETV
jgi:hypothetical protein